MLNFGPLLLPPPEYAAFIFCSEGGCELPYDGIKLEDGDTMSGLCPPRQFRRSRGIRHSSRYVWAKLVANVLKLFDVVCG